MTDKIEKTKTENNLIEEQFCKEELSEENAVKEDLIKEKAFKEELSEGLNETENSNEVSNYTTKFTSNSKKSNNYSLIITSILVILVFGFVLYSMSSNHLADAKSISGRFIGTGAVGSSLADNLEESNIDNIDLSNAPRISTDLELKKLGTINQNDGIVKTNFEIQNTGKSTLIIDYLETSCMCTSVSLNKDGIESPRFGMIMEGQEIPKDFKLELEPGEIASLNVFYDPLAHGIQEKSELLITRIIAIHSNDPVEPIKQVKFLLKQKK